MAKIRAIRPEFFTDEDLVECDPLARLLFQGLWCHACDNGHLQDKPRQLKLRILPADDCDVDTLLDQLVGAGGIARSGGWITIPNLGKYQKPDKRYFITCEKPGCSDAKPVVSTRREAPPEPDECPPDPADDTSPTHGGHHETTPSTRGGHTVATSFPSTDGDGDGDGDGDTYSLADAAHQPGPAKLAEYPERFSEFWSAYPRKVDKGHALKAWKKAIKTTDPDIVIAGTVRFAEQVAAERIETKFIPHASTWINGERWADETPQKGTPVSEPWEGAYR